MSLLQHDRIGHLYASRTPRGAFDGKDAECNVMILRRAGTFDYGQAEYYEVLLITADGRITYNRSYRLLPSARWIA